MPWASGPSDRPDRPLALRIHVSGAFASSSEGTHARIREIVREADRTFWSEVGAHLVIDEIVDGWKVDVSSCEDALNDLRATDPGEDVDVVVGMLGSEAHGRDWHGGMAMLGKGVMVVRSEDTDEERERRDTVAIFLHELGHALGARHDEVPGGIMSSRANGRARTYGEEAAQIIQQGLAAHGIVAEHRGRRAQAADGGSWSMTEANGSALEAAETRCKTAQARELDWPDVREACAPLMKLMMPGAGDGAAVE